MSTEITHVAGRAQQPRRARGWTRLWQTPVLALGLVCLALVAVTAPLRQNPAREVIRDLRQLRLALRGERPLPDLQTFIEPLLDKIDDFPHLEAEGEFLAGSYFYQRGQLDPKTADWDVRADTHLSRALTLNVGENDLGMLFYRLGMTRYRRGQNVGQALNWIRQGLDQGAENPAAGFAFLVDAYAKMSPPNLKAALSASDRHLEYVNDRDPEAFGSARLVHAELLRGLDRQADALRELNLIDANVSSPLLARVRLLQAECSEEEGAWRGAIDFWKQLQPLAGFVPGGVGRVCYALGLAHTRVQPVNETAVEALWKHAVAAGGEEGQAAGIRLGHLLMVGAKHDPEEGLKQWTAALASVRGGSDFKNRYLDLPKILELFDQACARILEDKDFARSQALAALMARVAPPGHAEEKIARLHMGWAQDLSTRAEAMTPPSDDLRREARARYQDAGDYFKQASLSRESAAKVDLFWQSATCYLSARDHASAAVMLEKFVKLAPQADRRARGHFALAEAYQAQAQKAKSRAHFLKCIELNEPPFVYRALSKLAQTEIDAGMLDRAREILVQILTRNGPGLEPEILEQALYSLGKVLYDLGDADEGAVRLREAVRRFPNNPRAAAVREKLADQAWERAKQIPITDLNFVAPQRRPLVEALQQKRRAGLLEAHDMYQALAADFEARYRTQELGVEDVTMWRSALFNVGILKIELGNFADALTYCRWLQILYRGKPESPHVARQAYFCWQHFDGQPAERARHRQAVLDIVQTALRDLDEIPKDRDEQIFMSGPRPFSREQWRQALRQWEVELQEPGQRAEQNGATPRE